MKTSSPDTLWEELESAGIVNGEKPGLEQMSSPWYVKLLMGFSGWLAALFLLGFFGISLARIMEHGAARSIVGTVLLAVAFVLLRQKDRNEFVVHLALALSLAGQAMLIWTIGEALGERSSMLWLSLVFLEGLLVAVMPDFVHRVFSTFAMAGSLAVFLTLNHLHYLTAGIIMLTATWIWLHEFDYPRQLARLVPMGYGLTLALFCVESTSVLGVNLSRELGRASRDQLLQPWVGETLIALVALYGVFSLLRRYQLRMSQRQFVAAMVATLVICALSLEVHGFTAGMLMLLLGFAGNNSVLMGLSIIALLLFQSSYYYFLDVTLLKKAAILCGFGLALLFIRWLLPLLVDEGDNADA